MITIDENQLGEKIIFQNEGLLRLSAIGTIRLSDISRRKFFEIETNQKIYRVKENFKLTRLERGLYQMELLVPVAVSDYAKIIVPDGVFVFTDLYSFNAVITEL